MGRRLELHPRARTPVSAQLDADLVARAKRLALRRGDTLTTVLALSLRSYLRRVAEAEAPRQVTVEDEAC